VNKKSGLLNTLRTYSEWIIPTGAVALVFVMLVPLPGIALRSVADSQHYSVGAGSAYRDPDSSARRVLRISKHDSLIDSDAAVARSGGNPPHSVAWKRRHICRRQGD